MAAFVTSLLTAAASITARRTASNVNLTRRSVHRSAFAGVTILAATAAFPLLSFADDTCSARGTTRSASTQADLTMSLSTLSGLKDIDGKEISPSVFDNKVVFAMNVASACGYTNSGYDLLKRLSEKYSPEDFVAVAIPCNSFGWQENGSPDEIKTFALARADKLLIMEKSDVNGNKPHPIVGLAKSKFPGRIMWNFDGRYVFDRNGQPVAKFGNSASPEDIEAAIEKAL